MSYHRKQWHPRCSIPLAVTQVPSHSAVTSTSVQLPPKDNDKRSINRKQTQVCAYEAQPCAYSKHRVTYTMWWEKRVQKSPLTTHPKHQLLRPGGGQDILTVLGAREALAGSGEKGEKSEGTQAHIPVASRAALLSFPGVKTHWKLLDLERTTLGAPLARLPVGRWQINQLSAIITIKGLSIRQGKSCGEKKRKENTQGLGVGSPSEGSCESEQRPWTWGGFPRGGPSWLNGSERLHPVKKTDGNPSLTLRE